MSVENNYILNIDNYLQKEQKTNTYDIDQISIAPVKCPKGHIFASNEAAKTFICPECFKNTPYDNETKSDIKAELNQENKQSENEEIKLDKEENEPATDIQ